MKIIKENLTGYKGFYNGLLCKGTNDILNKEYSKQYEENTIFEEDFALPCFKGMHFCINPIDVFDYYIFVNHYGELNEFANVEPLDESISYGKNYCTKKLKIKTKMSINNYIKECIKYIVDHKLDISDSDKFKITNKQCYEITTKIEKSMLINEYNGSKLCNFGINSNVFSFGNNVDIFNSGKHTQIVSYGKLCNIKSDDTSITINNGDKNNIFSTGICSRIVSNGNFNTIQTNGRNSLINLSGIGSTVNCYGLNSRVKATKGNWITFSERTYNGNDSYTKTEYVDGEKIKENTWYRIENGEFIACSVN